MADPRHLPLHKRACPATSTSVLPRHGGGGGACEAGEALAICLCDQQEEEVRERMMSRPCLSLSAKMNFMAQI